WLYPVIQRLLFALKLSHAGLELLQVLLSFFSLLGCCFTLMPADDALRIKRSEPLCPILHVLHFCSFVFQLTFGINELLFHVLQSLQGYFLSHEFGLKNPTNTAARIDQIGRLKGRWWRNKPTTFV